MNIKSFIAVILFITANTAIANHPHDEVLNYINDIQSLDCNTQGLDCRYYSALEAVSYFDACPIAFSKISNTTLSDVEQKQLSDWLNKWTFLSTTDLKMSVANENNALRKYLSQQRLESLKGLSLEELATPCSKMAIIINNETPDIYSDLLKKTQNYEIWLNNQHTKPIQFNH